METFEITVYDRYLYLFCTYCVLVEGKSALKGGVAPFVAAASAAYSTLENSAKQDLVVEAKEKTLCLTSAAVKKRGAKIFDKMGKLVGKLFCFHF